MKITDVETVVVGNPWKNWIFVRVRTDEGLDGLGEVTDGVQTLTAEASVREAAALVVGEDATRPVAIADTLYAALYLNHAPAIAGIEIACWDILGKVLGVPIWQLLGGAHRDRVAAYANGWYSGPRTPEAFGERAAQVAGSGFRALKFDPFGTARGSISADELDLSIDIVGAVAAACGPDVALLIEGHDRFTVSDALKVSRRLERFSPTWFEAPVMSTDVDATLAVAARSEVPIAAGERFVELGDFARLAAPRTVSTLQPETLAVGGISQTMKVAAVAEAYGAQIAPHNAQSPVTTMANLHIAAAAPNVAIQETFDEFAEPWAKDLFTTMPQRRDGFLLIPDGPGLGIELDLDVARRHPYRPENALRLFQEDWQYRGRKTTSD